LNLTFDFILNDETMFDLNFMVQKYEKVSSMLQKRKKINSIVQRPMKQIQRKSQTLNRTLCLM